MEAALDPDRYVIMEYVSSQTKEFRFAELYHLLKKQDPQKWKAEEVKISLEWLADIGLGGISGHARRFFLVVKKIPGCYNVHRKEG